MRTVTKCKTLLGHRNLDFSIACLKSFIDNSQTEIHLEIFEDGTLSAEDESKLLLSLTNSRINPKRFRDEVINEKLLAYPNAYRFRNEMIFGQKLFDIMLFDDDDLFYIDSDIFFLKSFTLPKFKDIPIFMVDVEHAYSFSPVDFYRIKHPIFPFINAGFFYFPNIGFDINFVEALLGNHTFSKGKITLWLEQTIWAFLAGRFKTICYFNKEQIVMAQEKINITGNSLAIHLISTYRYHFNDIQRCSSSGQRVEDYKVIEIEHSLKYLTKLDFAKTKVAKRFKRFKKRILVR